MFFVAVHPYPKHNKMRVSLKKYISSLKYTTHIKTNFVNSKLLSVWKIKNISNFTFAICSPQPYYS